MSAAQLPAHLQKYKAPDVGAALSQNLGSAMPPHVSIGGGRFTLIDASNTEIPVPTFDPKIGVYLDAVIIDSNEKMSRQYFARPYDPSAPGAPPDCWSDNGIAASIGASAVPVLQPPHPRAGQPAATCAECPMTVWGSKINPNGKPVPACSEKQKIALLIPGFNTLFLLAVPPNSHSYLREYVELSKGTNVNIANVITRISFVAGVQGTLQFQGISYIDEPTAILRQAAYTEKKTDALVGRNDVPRLGTAQIVQQNTPGMTNGQAARLEQQLQAPVLNQPMTASQFQPAQQVQQPGSFVPPGAFQPVTSSPQQFAPPTQLAAVQPTAASPSETPAPARRRRRTAQEMQAGMQPAPGQQAPTAAPQAPFPVSNQAPSTSPAPFPASQQPGALPGQTDMGFGMAQGQPAAANPEVSQMLDSFFKG